MLARRTPHAVIAAEAAIQGRRAGARPRARPTSRAARCRRGHIYVANGLPGEEFSREDEETLIDTSPVGVVVFDAKAETPASFSREARSLVDGLRLAHQSPEELLDTLTVQRADGQAC